MDLQRSQIVASAWSYSVEETLSDTDSELDDS